MDILMGRMLGGGMAARIDWLDAVGDGAVMFAGGAGLETARTSSVGVRTTLRGDGMGELILGRLY